LHLDYYYKKDLQLNKADFFQSFHLFLFEQKMDPTGPNTTLQLMTLQETAQKLAVSVSTLLKWNEYHILKPTITQTGEIGYTREQIDQFLAIQQSFQENQMPSPLTQEDKLAPQAMYAEPILPDLSVQGPSDKPKTHSHRLAASFLVIFVLCIIIAVVEQEKIQSLLSQYSGQVQKQTQNQSGVLGKQTSTLQFTKPISLVVQLQGEILQSKNLNSQNASVFINKYPLSVSQKNRISTTSAVGLIHSPKGQLTGNVQPDIAKTIHDVSTFASETTSTAKKVDGANSALDENGNIKGEANKTDTIAMVLGESTGGLSTSLPIPVDLRNQFILLTMIALAGSMVVLKARPYKASVVPVLHHAPIGMQKIFEVDQKMDGTVVVYFQGNTYKISKPELYSDSDRFIERLMTLSQPHAKELEYDSSRDEKITLTTPLSRLVTRLGFVGIKRELFFPRTSKNRVMFRKYITLEDVAAMNLTLPQITSDLLQIS